MAARILFITGTDTGVGKTVLTSLLLAHGLRQSAGVLAMKPFCSGGHEDVELLAALQKDRLPKGVLNPFYFEEPVAPLVSQRLHRQRVSLAEAARAVRKGSKYCRTLLVEGSGGLLVPLGERFTVLDLIRKVRAEVIVASRDRLGTINHTLLTAEALKNAGVRKFKTVLMQTRNKDFSSESNAEVLRELLAPNPLFVLPFLSGDLSCPRVISRHAARMGSLLGRIIGRRRM